MVYGLNPAATDAIHFGCAGTTGDGINWVKDHDGVVLEGLIHYVSGPDSRLGHYGPCSILREYAPRVTVNLDGERFVNEGATSIGATAAAANDTEDNTAERLEAESVGTYLEQKDNKGFAIMSGTDIETFQKQLDYAIDHDVAWRADSLEDLANQTGINIEGLTKTIADYNAAYAAGEGSDFGITNEFMTPIAETGPYYAFMMRTLYNLMDYGVQVNSDCQPITVDGSLVFDNVQTAGSIMVSNYSFMWGGISHSTALTSGSYVGNLARHRVLG
jgi:fumarate reductase flavoprotein subunit